MTSFSLLGKLDNRLGNRFTEGWPHCLWNCWSFPFRHKIYERI